MTYQDARTAGYTDGRTAWQRGYISRKTDINTQPVKYDRYGNPYVLVPSYQSTQYCVRRYLTNKAATL